MQRVSEIPAWRHWLLGGFVAAGLIGVAVLFLFDPEHTPIFPVCPLHLLTGWDCPGCGTLRAMHQLLHGHLAAAWRFNPLTVSLLPVAGWLLLREIIWQFSGFKLPGLVTRPAFGWALAVVAVFFGIIRNLPGFHV
jgi:hypothetical protein